MAATGTNDKPVHNGHASFLNRLFLHMITGSATMMFSCLAFDHPGEHLMPHFGHMKPDMAPADAALLRSRLHLRCGRRRITEKKTADGIATLYDAMLSGIHWLALTKGVARPRVIPENGDLPDDADLIRTIKKSAPEIAPDLDLLKDLAGLVIGGAVPVLDSEAILALIDRVMTRLGVLPFDEKLLPPEDPEAF